MINVMDVINRIKFMKHYGVDVAIPEDFRFSGIVPFDMIIGDNRIKAKILAISHEDALEKMERYLDDCSRQ